MRDSTAESVNSPCEKNSVHGPLLQRAAHTVEEINGTLLYSRSRVQIIITYEEQVATNYH